MLKEALETGVGKAPLFDFTNAERYISYQFSCSLKPEYQDALEAIAERERKEYNLTTSQKSFEDTVSKFKQGLSLEAYDESVAHVQMTIDFDV